MVFVSFSVPDSENPEEDEEQEERLEDSKVRKLDLMLSTNGTRMENGDNKNMNRKW